MDIAEYARGMKIPSSICFSSKRNTGKTVMVNALVKALVNQGKVDSVIIFSNTVKYNKDYPDFPDAIKMEYDEEKLKRLIEHQKRTPRERRKQVLVVLDDLLGDTSVKADLLMSVFATSRHYFITPILICQIANRLLSPTAKANSDYLFISRLNRQQMTSIWETSVTNIDKTDFIRMVEGINKNYNFLVIDNTSQSNEPEEFLAIVYVADAGKEGKGGTGGKEKEEEEEKPGGGSGDVSKKNLKVE